MTRSPVSAREAPAIVYPELGQFGRGRLGNQLWQIAGTLGIAARLGRAALFPDWRFRPYFSVPDEHFCSEPPVGDPAVEFAEHLAPSHRDWLQDPRLWLHIEPTIRAYFAPSQEARARLEARRADFLSLPNRTAVHIRRGDYVVKSEFFPLQSETYLRGALELVGPSNVVVFSDDVAWCRANLAWMEPAMFMAGNADYEDLFLMARCQHHVIAASTFSWWGAFLSENPAPVYPRPWFGPRFSERFPGADPSLFLLESWVGIDV